MQYAIVDNERREAFAAGRGHCPVCGAVTIAKCGPRVLPHWAHQGRRHCDRWWERETVWHRQWKSLLPEDCREISHIGKNDAIHLADITTQTGIIIKVRQATMRDADRRAREAFYKNLLWIIDGRGFRHNFDVYHPLPHPNSAIARDIVWLKTRRDIEDSTDGAFYRLSASRRDHPDTAVTKAIISALGAPAHAHGLEAIRTDVEKSYRGHHQYDWIRPRQVWLDSPRPVFIDFGGDHLVKLEIYDASGLPCIRYVDKRTLVRDAMRESDARAIGTG